MKNNFEYNHSKRQMGEYNFFRKLLLVGLSSSVILVTGCQSEAPFSSNTTKPEVIQSEINDNANESTIQFSELSKYQFIFSSGAGAWQTMLNIDEDGTFNGNYSDSDMGDTGEGYPNGINYESTFEGVFTTPKKLNEYTYSMSIKSINLEKEVGSAEIIDGIKYIYSKPYGLDDAKEIYIYTPEAPVSELPEGYKDWIQFVGINEEQDSLSFFGLYNVETESGFSSYKIDAIEDASAETNSNVEVTEIEMQAENMHNRLMNEDLNQSEMNFLAKDIYVLWDDELNKIWRQIKDTIESGEMSKLTSDQKEWISQKEKEVTEAGDKYEGGSIRPMVEYLKGAELTKARVYELIQLLSHDGQND